jgi:hypothetical protein
LVVVAMAAVGTWTERRRLKPVTLLVGMILILVTVSHLVLEVHGRYHAPVVPLLCLLAAVGVDRALLRPRSAVDGPVAD